MCIINQKTKKLMVLAAFHGCILNCLVMFPCVIVNTCMFQLPSLISHFKFIFIDCFWSLPVQNDSHFGLAPISGIKASLVNIRQK